MDIKKNIVCDTILNVFLLGNGSEELIMGRDFVKISRLFKFPNIYNKKN